MDLKSLFCPCIILNNIDIIVKRDKPKNFWTSLNSTTCLTTSIFCLVCWPVSPLMILHQVIQKFSLRKIYPNYLNDKNINISNWNIINTLIWPISVNQHFKFIQEREADQSLLFEWEFDIISDLQKKYSITDIVVYIIGPKQSGKSNLLSKLILSTKDIDEISEADQNMSKIRVGIRPVSVAFDTVSFYELWEIPSDKINFLNIAFKNRDPNFVIITVDINQDDPIQNLSTYFNEIVKFTSNVSTKIIVVITKLDLIKQVDRSDHPSIRLIKNWAFSQNIDVIEHSSFENYGLIDLKSALKSNSTV